MVYKIEIASQSQIAELFLPIYAPIYDWNYKNIKSAHKQYNGFLYKWFNYSDVNSNNKNLIDRNYEIN